MRSPRAWATNAALCVVAILLTSVAIEAAVRLFMPMNLDFYDWQKIKRVSDRPGQSFELIPGGRNDFYVGVPVQINSFGLRDREFEARKPQGTLRIVGVGDSVAFGYGVRLEDTYLKVLESELNAAATGGTRYQVINAGMEATGLDYYDSFLRSSAQRFEPDLMIVGITLNDVADYRRRGHESESREYSSRSPIRRVNTFLLLHSQSYLAGYINLKAAMYRFGFLDFNQEHWYDLDVFRPPSEEMRQAWISTRELLTSIVAAARERGYPLLFVVFPMEVQLDQESLQRYQRELRLTIDGQALSGEPQQELRNFGERMGVTVVDLLPAFRAAHRPDLFLRKHSMSADPVHPSAAGHRVAGHALFRFLHDDPTFAWMWSRATDR